MSEANQVENTEAPAQAEAQAPVALSMNDLTVLANIIDLASSRGAFKAGELTTVGATYEKLVGFVKSVQDQQAAAAEAAGEESKAMTAGEESGTAE